MTTMHHSRGTPRRRAAAPDGAPGGGPKPFLKWAGGKRQLLGQLWPHLPERFGRYHEPFLGSGALFFALHQRRDRKLAYLSDTNERLVRAYCGLRDDPDGVIELLRSYRHEKSFFLELRKRDIDAATDPEVAAWLIYLNKTAFNGLYRVNRRNIYNVPFGDYARPNFCDVPTLRACAASLKRARIELLDFWEAARRPKAGDLVYFDPPYVPLSSTSSFTSYTAAGFSPAQQERLRDVALGLKDKGVHVMVSNSSAPRVRELYRRGFRIIEVSARRSVNSRADRRGPVRELLMV